MTGAVVDVNGGLLWAGHLLSSPFYIAKTQNVVFIVLIFHLLLESFNIQYINLKNETENQTNLAQTYIKHSNL